jgi:diguanylate cyclase (GGDEF)-like protein
MTSEGGRLWPLVESLGDAATATNGTQTVLQGLMQQLGSLCDGSAELWEATSDAPQTTSRWRLRASYSPQPLALHGGADIPADDQIVRVATTLRTLVISEPTATLAMPILAFGRLQGVLRVATVQADSAIIDLRRDLERFGSILGLYLHGAELNEALASGALRDRLTGIANQAQLHDHLERELARARRARRSFALLMIALDRFDALASDLGLPLRDRVMQSLAVMLRDACRDGDIIGRYGTDRFLILLPDSNGQGAQMAAQRYLQHFYRRPVTLPEGKALYLDVSIGIALFPVDGLELGELVENATMALREAQRLGGNRAVAA